MSKNKKTDCVVGWLVRGSERVLSGSTEGNAIESVKGDNIPLDPECDSIAGPLAKAASRLTISPHNLSNSGDTQY
jgi:hypothetical protein